MTQRSSRDALEEFLNQLSAWERKYSELDETLEDDYEPWKQAHAESDAVRTEILRKWCHPALLTTEMLQGGCLETPHRYDPKRDEIRVICESTDSAVYEYEQRAGLRSVFRFLLGKSQSSWLIQNAQLRALSEKGITWKPLLI